MTGFPFRRPLFVGLGALALLAGVSAAQTIHNIGALAPTSYSESFAVSADGSAVTGFAGLSGGGYRAVRWTPGGGLQNLGTVPGGLRSMGYAISADGASVTGQSIISGGAHVFFWTVAGGVQDLGTLPGQNVSYGYAISADGLVVGGGPSSGAAGHAFVCPSGGSMVDLGTLAGGSAAAIFGLNADGSVGTGFSNTPAGDRAIRWTAAGMQNLGVLPGGATSEGDAISADGTVIAGSSDSTSGRRAFRWTAATGMVDLGVAPGRTTAYATSITADGSVIVGYDELGAILWREDLGVVDLRTFVLAQGVNLSGWTTLITCYGISADGTALTGTGTYNGQRRGFVVRGLPPICAPRIAAQPADAATCSQVPASFAVAAAGDGPFTYRWQIETMPGTWMTLGHDPLPLPCGGHAYALDPFAATTNIGVHACAGVSAYAIRATVTNDCAETASEPATLTLVASGDLNCDTAVDNGDIDAFVLALIDPAAYSATYPTCAVCAADTNHDSAVDNGDIDSFVACLLGGGCP